MVYRDIKTINIPSNDLDILQVEYNIHTALLKNNNVTQFNKDENNTLKNISLLKIIDIQKP